MLYEVITPSAPPPWLNDGFLAAFLSFINHYAPAVRNGGGLARRALSDLRRCFPLFDADPEKPEPLLHALEAGGFLLQGEDRLLTVNLPRWNGLLELPEEKRVLYLASRTALDPVITSYSIHYTKLYEYLRTTKFLPVKMKRSMLREFYNKKLH